jgi:hypothetical protein
VLPSSPSAGEISNISNWFKRSNSIVNRQHDCGRSTCSEEHIVESPLSASPIQTKMPEVKYDPCHVGHSLEEEPGPFVVSLISSKVFHEAEINGCNMPLGHIY